ncbi:MAG: NAD+ synthase [Candidatus Methanomethylophilaceae archaeon]|nr:NAD+ synthase [Candidatus Methanomethylophilaceae archaeon]
MNPQDRDRKADTITRFISDTVEAAGAEGVVVGLSGGLDSALVTRLCVQALGPDRVHTAYLPSSSSLQDDERATSSLSRLLGTRHEVIRIDSIVAAAAATLNAWEDRLGMGNLMARSRMMILYHIARRRRLLVMGTGNRSEIMMGYFTKHGDGACDALPIGGLFKTEVRGMAQSLGIPEEFLIKPPSAGLWDGQTDEEEMGISYLELDAILAAIAEGNEATEISYQTGSSISTVEVVLQRVESSRHKSRLPPTPRL